MAKKKQRKLPRGDKYANLASNKPGSPKSKHNSDGPVDIERTLRDIQLASMQRGGFTEFAETHNKALRANEASPSRTPKGNVETLSRRDQERFDAWPEYQ